MLVKPFELRLSAAEKFIQLVEARAPTVDDAHRLMLLPLLNDECLVMSVSFVRSPKSSKR
jgi:hypothetical protein